MKFKLRFSLLTLLILTAFIAHFVAKRNVASRLATASGTVRSIWIPFVIEVSVSEQEPLTVFELANTTAVSTSTISLRRYVGMCGMYTLVSSQTQMDWTKPWQVQLKGYHARAPKRNEMIDVRK